MFKVTVQALIMIITMLILLKEVASLVLNEQNKWQTKMDLILRPHFCNCISRVFVTTWNDPCAVTQCTTLRWRRASSHYRSFSHVDSMWKRIEYKLQAKKQTLVDSQLSHCTYDTSFPRKNQWKISSPEVSISKGVLEQGFFYWKHRSFQPYLEMYLEFPGYHWFSPLGFALEAFSRPSTLLGYGYSYFAAETHNWHLKTDSKRMQSTSWQMQRERRGDR